MAEDKKIDKETKSEAKSASAPQDKPVAKTAAQTPEEKALKSKAEAKAAAPKKKAATKSAAKKKAGKKPPTGKSPSRAPLAPKTFFAKPEENPNWRLIDANGQTLGRLCAQVAHILMGKDKPTYTRHAAPGDFVIVINAEKVHLTGNKWADKVYHRHTGFPGGIRTITAGDLRDQKPEQLITKAVYGMLPKGHVGRKWNKRLRVFAGDQHPHTAQKPEVHTLRH